MKKYIGDRDFYRRLFTVMIPVLIQNVITNFVSLLDNIMVGRVGTEPMSGVAIVNQLIFVFNLCIFGGLSGAGIFTAQYYGKGDDEGVRATMRFKGWIALAASTVALGLFAFFGENLISLFIHEGEDNLDLAATMFYAKQYLAIMMIQLPLFAFLNIYTSTLRETGNTRLPMTAGVIAVMVNLIGNYLLIYGKFGAPRLGVQGAAIATVVARVVEVVISVAGSKFHGVWKTMRVPVELSKKIAVKGLPLLANELLWSSGMTTLNQIMSIRGLEVVSAENICSTVSNLFFCSFFAMGTTISIIIGQHLGAGDFDAAVDDERKLISFAVVLCVAVGAVMALIAPLFPRIYNTTDIVKSLAAKMIIINAIMMPSNAFTNSCYFTLRSGGRVWITMLFDSIYLWVLAIPVTLALVKLTALPIVPVYAISYGIDIIKCVFGFILVRSGIWINNLVNEDL